MTSGRFMKRAPLQKGKSPSRTESRTILEGHSRGRPGPKCSVRLSKPWKTTNKRWAGIHDLKVRTSILQDTKEYLNQRVPKSEFSGSQKSGDKGGGEEGRSGGRVNRA